MYPVSGERQKKEIETIRPRTIEVKLSDADVERISKLAGEYGLTVGALIENFLGDLVCGTYSNGSDERMYARQWFERCWFSTLQEFNFLYFLISNGALEEVMEAWKGIESSRKSIVDAENAIADGMIKGRNGEVYTWKDIKNRDGRPIYSSKEEWEAQEELIMQGELECIEEYRVIIDNYWNEYTQTYRNTENGIFEEEMKIVLNCWNDYQKLLG